MNDAKYIELDVHGVATRALPNRPSGRLQLMSFS